MEIVAKRFKKLSRKIFILILLSAIGAVIFLPQFIFKPNNANAVIANPVNYKDEVTAKGQIISGEETNINSNFPIVAEKIHCTVGSEVKKGDVLIKVDKKSTISRYSELLGNFGINAATASLQNLIDVYKTLPSALTDKVPFNIESITKNLPKNASKVLVSDILKEENIPDTFTSPIDGYVTQLNASYTDLSTAGNPIVVLTTSDTLRAKVQVKESDIGKVKEGMNVDLLIDASNMKFSGQVDSISSVARKATSAINASTIIDVYITFPQSSQVKSGYNTSATIYCSNEKTGIPIPFEAINQENENGEWQEYCYILQNDKAVKKIISVDKECENVAIISAGLNVGDIVLTDFNENNIDEGEIYCIDSVKNIAIN